MNKLDTVLAGLFTFAMTAGNAHALFAIPVDEPSTWVIFSVGLVAVLARRFMRK